jgi:hypothetical protein
LISTVAENRKGYTLRQFERAKEARRLYYIVGTPTANNFKSLLRMKVIQNCPVTVEGVNISEKNIWTRHVKPKRQVNEAQAQTSEK